MPLQFRAGESDVSDMSLFEKVFPDGCARDLISGGEIDWSKNGKLVHVHIRLSG